MKKLICLGLMSTILVNCEINQPSKNQIIGQPIKPNFFNLNSEESHQESHDQQFQMNLKPLPLFMPTFKINDNGQVKMTNVFDTMENEFQKIEDNMENQHAKMLEKMMIKKDHMNKFIQMSMNKIQEVDSQGNTMIKITYNNEPLIGGGNHDIWVNQLRKEQFMSPSILGNDQHDNWEQKTSQIQYNMPLIGGDGHDNWLQEKIEQIQNKRIQNSFPKRLIGLKKQEESQITQKNLQERQNYIDNHYHNSDIMPGSNKNLQEKTSINDIVNGVFKLIKNIKKSNKDQKNTFKDIQEIKNKNIQTEVQNSNKPQVLIK